MTIQLRSEADIAKMREAGRLAAEVLELIGDYVVPGVSTDELDRICHEHIVNVQKAKIGLYIGQSSGLPRHSLRKENPQERRYY
jgi:methionine aminopeptidase